MSLRRAWDEQSANWVAWTRTPGHDSFDLFHGARFFELLPPPGRLTLDLGAGEGRVGRALRERGHHVVGVEGSPGLARANADLAPGRAVLADIAHLPLPNGIADLAVAFMSLHDVDDMDGAVIEAARVLQPGGCLALAIVHPMNSAGEFAYADREDDPPFVVTGSYFEQRRYADDVERDGLSMRFESIHRPLESYSRALEAAGFVVESMREVTEPKPSDKWYRMPLFLDLRARRAG